MRGQLTQARLKELLHYDPETGIFTWMEAAKRNNRAIVVGRRAGSLLSIGYRAIGVDGSSYLESRLAWLYMVGEHPECLIDHENHDTTDNTWKNLRPASHEQNARNKRLNKNNTSGAKGITWYGPKKGWCARVFCEGESRYLGCFGDIDAAEQFVKIFRAMFHGEFACHG